MKRTSPITKLQNEILEQLKLVQYATISQLAYLCKSWASDVSEAAAHLNELGYVEETVAGIRPKIMFLTTAGARLVGVPLPSGRRHSSWAVMAHACHLNILRELLANQHEGFRFYTRLELLRKGFNPGVGDHGAVDGSGKSWYVLLDDFLMGSDRIKRAWTRRHTPNLKYWPDHTGRAWSAAANHFLVVSTDERNAKRHEQAILRNRLPADVMTIKPLWKM